MERNLTVVAKQCILTLTMRWYQIGRRDQRRECSGVKSSVISGAVNTEWPAERNTIQTRNWKHYVGYTTVA